MQKRIMVEHLENTGRTLLTFASQVGLAKHPGNIGSAREGLARHFLANNLPSNVAFMTGEIFDCNDSRSGQIDLIVYPRTAPLVHLHDVVQLVYADLVIAAIEVKSNLTTANLESRSHLLSALQHCKKTKELKRLSPIQIGGHQELEVTSIPSFVFAYEGPEEQTLLNKLEDFRMAENCSFDLLPDLFVILSKNYYLVKNNGWIINRVPNVEWTSGRHTPLLGMYVYLVKLVEAFHLQPRLMPFSNYLQSLE